jgi:hypothetical protein
MNFPFINNVLSPEPASFITADGELFEPDREIKQSSMSKHFSEPRAIKQAQMAPISALSDETFRALFSLLKPSSFGTPIESRQDLEQFATSEHWKLVYSAADDHDDFSLDQLCCFLMFHAKLASSIQWHKVAQVYNESEPGQQAAIYEYFRQYIDFDLKQLLELTAAPVDLPSAFDKSFESRERNGDIYLFSDGLQEWLREDQFHQQYRVNLKTSGATTKQLIATAPTLELAVAKASTHVIQTQNARGYWYCDISQGGMVLATAYIEWMEKDLAKRQKGSDGIKLKWDLDSLCIQKEFVRKIQDNELNAEQIKAMVKHTTPIKKDAFIKTLYAVEKALGLQWSKVYRLEDELGL